MHALIRWSIGNPVAVNLLFLLMIVAGVLAYLTMPRDVFPSIGLDRVSVTTVFPGATAEEVAELVTARIEEAIADVDGLDDITSTSRAGVSEVLADVELGEDVDRVSRRVETAVRRVQDLPIEIEDEPRIEAVEVGFPLMVINVSGVAPPDALRAWTERVRRRIAQEPGIASVTASGLPTPEVWVELDPERLDAYDVTVADVVDALQRWRINVPGGTAEAGGTATAMRTIGPLGAADDVDRAPASLEAVRIVRPGRAPLRLGAIASVREAQARSDRTSTFNGEPSTALIVLKDDTSDAVALSTRLRALVGELQRDLPDGLRLDFTSDTAVYVRARLRTVYQSGAVALAVILAMLYLLLDARTAAVTALGVPTAVLAALIMMAFIGMSINLLSLFALILVLGLVVDDAIIIGENIYRRMQLGEAPLTAAVRGAREVAWPVTVTVLTTIAAFFPLVFLPGVFGAYLAVIPTVVAITMLMSLVEALIILPSHVAEASRIGRPVDPDDTLDPPPLEAPDGPAEASSAALAVGSDAFSRIARRYRGALDVALRWRYAVVAGALVVTALAILTAYVHMPFVLVNPVDVALFSVRVEAPPAAPLRETARLVTGVERTALAHLEAEDVNALKSWAGSFYRPNVPMEFDTAVGQLWVELTEYDQRTRPGTVALDALRAALDGDETLQREARSLTFVVEDGGPPTAPDIEIVLQSDEPDALRRVADDLMNHLRALPGVSDVRDDDPPGRPERRVRVSPTRAARYGAEPQGVGLTLQAALEGVRAASFRRDDDEVDVLVKLPEYLRTDGGFDLRRLRVPVRVASTLDDSAFGDASAAAAVGADPRGSVRLVPLEAVATIENTQGRATVRRRDRQPSLTITTEVDESVTTTVRTQQAADVHLAEDPRVVDGTVRVQAEGKQAEIEALVAAILRALAVALLFIYFMLGTLFRSFLQPFAILITVPVATVGVIVGFALTGQALDMLAMIGTVALAGVVVNDSLVLIDFINARRRAGVPRHEATLDAGLARLRPILLTTVTTVGGLLPLALTSSGQAAVLSAMADAMCWGLSLATVLTLVIVPCAYVVIDDIATWLRARLLPAAAPSSGGSPDASPT
ncbi:MAG: efflux RND transporter permease subunit [Acidobacteriota bacterium]